MRIYEDKAVPITSLDESGVKRREELPVENGWAVVAGIWGRKAEANSFIRLILICPLS